MLILKIFVGIEKYYGVAVGKMLVFHNRSDCFARKAQTINDDGSYLFEKEKFL